MASVRQVIEGTRRFAGLNARKILLGIVLIITAYLVIPPIGMLLFSAVRGTEGKLPFEATNFTLENLARVFTSEITLRLFQNTAIYAIGAVVVGLGIAALFSWFLERTNVPARKLMFVLILAPLGMPMIITSMAWIQLVNPTNGLINVILRAIFGLEGTGPLNVYSMGGMIIITGLTIAPLIYIMISGTFSRIDPSIEEAGRTSGAGPFAVLRRISMPLLGPALFAAVIYYIVIVMETFEIPAMLGQPKGIFVFSSAIYYAINPLEGGKLSDYGVASTYGVILLIIAAVLIYVYGRYVRNADRFATMTGKGYRPRLIDLGKWKYLPTTLMSMYFIIVVLLPLMTLLWTSLAPPYARFSIATFSKLDLDAYRNMFQATYLIKSVKNTLIISTSVAVIATFLVTLISWLSVRGKIAGARLLDRLSFVIIGVPGIVLALVLIFIYASMPVPIYGTVWVIVVAGVTRSLPFGTRLMSSAFLQVHRELEEAAATSGAGLKTTFFRIVMPLLWPSFARGFVWFFVATMRDTTMALMLHAAGNQTIAVALWMLWTEEARFADAAAIAVPMMIVTMVLTYIVAKQTMLQED